MVGGNREWDTAIGAPVSRCSFPFLLAVLMLVLGGVNNFHFGKKAARLSESQEGEVAAQEHSKLEGGFSRSVMLEAALGVAVLLVTAILVFETPARGHPVDHRRQKDRSA